ncbi:MAG TPA: hypothetical protein DEA51_00720 [Erysipelotrichaceae bacterium]|nr:hypothetical protein [Erysipelotrichaceae bacterium]
MKKSQRLIAIGSLAIAMAILPILLFRGTTSILAMILTPIIIGIWFYRHHRQYVVSVMIAYLLLVAILATTQIVFAFMYLMQGWFLHELFHRTRKLRFVHWILYTLISLLIILIGMFLTQTLIQIPLISIMIRLGGGVLGFILIVLIQACVVSIAHLMIYKQLKKRGFTL